MIHINTRNDQDGTLAEFEGHAVAIIVIQEDGNAGASFQNLSPMQAAIALNETLSSLLATMAKQGPRKMYEQGVEDAKPFTSEGH